jgi:SAM-dependent MidA family methyltransferase
MVTVDSNGALSFALAPVPTVISPLSRGAPTNDAIYEFSPTATAIAERIAEIVAAKGGAALFVDYGYGDEAAFGETLQAVGGHKYADILERPGEVDLSAHVDFAALAAAAQSHALTALGPISQSDLLNGLGIAARAQKLARSNPAEVKSLAAAMDRLTNPDQMGTLFKAFALLPNGAPRPPGF